MKKTDLLVEGKKITLPVSILIIEDVDDCMRNISKRIHRWGRVLAQAEREKSLADSYYRAWRANVGKKILEEQKGLAEWKVNQLINSDPQFLKVKNKIAEAEFNVSVLSHFYEALIKQAFILPSKGARQRDQISTQGMNTKTKKQEPNNG